MFEYIYANGDSWTFGNGIDEDPQIKSLGLIPPLSDPERLKLTWAGHLSKLLDCPVKNDSLGGGSNARILRTTTDFIQKYPAERRENLLVVLGFTTLERNEIYLEENGFSGYYKFNAVQDFVSQFPIADPLHNNKFSKKIEGYRQDYMRHVYNYKMSADAYFLQLTLLKNLLENLNIKYIFFNALPWHGFTESERYIFKYRLGKFNDPRCVGFTSPTMSMVEFTTNNGYPKSSCLHTMIDGHRAWAEYLNDKIKEIYE